MFNIRAERLTEVPLLKYCDWNTCLCFFSVSLSVYLLPTPRPDPLPFYLHCVVECPLHQALSSTKQPGNVFEDETVQPMMEM